MNKFFKSSSVVINSFLTSPPENFAFEEFLLENIPSGKDIIFIYENNLSVITGRFQNPWKECSLQYAGREGAGVYRRISGGGTVVHSKGNLNFSIIKGSKDPAKEENLLKISSALLSLGIDVCVNNKFDILAGSEKKKLSGSAFRQTAKASLHHGTLLVNAPLDKLKKLLDTAERNIYGARGVASVSSPVINLTELQPGISVNTVRRQIINEWTHGNDGGIFNLQPDNFPRAELEEKINRLNSWEWIWGRTPAFKEKIISTDSAGGRAVLDISVKNGIISNVECVGGVLKEKEIHFLEGLKYRGEDVLNAAAVNAVNGVLPGWAEDLAHKIDGYSC